MNKYLIILDTHIKDSNIELINDLFKQVIQICKDRNIHIILHGGDIFNSRTSQSLSVLKCFNGILQLLDDNGISMFAIPGNHEKTNLEDEASFLDIFTMHPNFILYSSETTDNLISDNISFHFLPYFKESGSYLQRLKNLTIHSSKKNILLTHIAVQGVKNNDGSVVENNVKSELFNQFDRVIVAHYHNVSRIEPNIDYLGSLYQANFGEDDHKGVHILHDGGDIEFVNLNFPKYFTYRFDCKDIKQIVDQLKQVNHEYNKIRFIITGNETEIENFNRSIFDNYNVDVKFEKTYSQKIVELKKYKEDDIMLSFKQFCLDKQVQDNIRVKSINYLEKVL